MLIHTFLKIITLKVNATASSGIWTRVSCPAPVTHKLLTENDSTLCWIDPRCGEIATRDPTREKVNKRQLHDDVSSIYILDRRLSKKDKCKIKKQIKKEVMVTFNIKWLRRIYPWENRSYQIIIILISLENFPRSAIFRCDWIKPMP